MILFYTPNSPFARTARIALREWGVLNQAEERFAANREAHNPVLKFSPVGRVPTLVDGDLVITEARAVFSYITARSGVTFPRHFDWKAAAVEGQVLGFLEGIASLIRENRREAHERSPFLISVERDRMIRCLSHLEELARRNHLHDVSEFAGAALGSELALVSLHDFAQGWDQLYPHLSDWQSLQTSRQSMQATQPTL